MWLSFRVWKKPCMSDEELGGEICPACFVTCLNTCRCKLSWHHQNVNYWWLYVLSAQNACPYIHGGRISVTVSANVLQFCATRQPHNWSFVREVHEWPVFPHKGSVMRKAVPWHDLIMHHHYKPLLDWDAETGVLALIDSGSLLCIRMAANLGILAEYK